MNSDFERFETDVMKKIIVEDSSIAEILKRQYKSAKVIERKFTGVGFFTDFEIADKSLRLPNSPNFELGITQAAFGDLERGVGFVLFIRNGLIDFLEGYTYDEAWPEKITTYTLIDPNSD